MEALEREQPDVILTDIRMPGIDGLDLLRQVTARYPSLPVIIMTAHSDLDSAVSAFHGGAFEYLPKPFDLDEAVDSGPPRPAAAARRSPPPSPPLQQRRTSSARPRPCRRSSAPSGAWPAPTSPS